MKISANVGTVSDLFFFVELNKTRQRTILNRLDGPGQSFINICAVSRQNKTNKKSYRNLPLLRQLKKNNSSLQPAA
jgi:hypothetical protein